mmetsp:Transcript_12551/g.33724  ORF Transcript_12551/g.33724 Transcript_12551/m.33724 type:complete len:151 (-) Transcript_12551:399-851(-)
MTALRRRAGEVTSKEAMNKIERCATPLWRPGRQLCYEAFQTARLSFSFCMSSFAVRRARSWRRCCKSWPAAGHMVHPMPPVKDIRRHTALYLSRFGKNCSRSFANHRRHRRGSPRRGHQKSSERQSEQQQKEQQVQKRQLACPPIQREAQ